MSWQPYDSRGRPNTPKSDSKDISLADEPLRSRAAQMVADCPYKGELGYVSVVRDPGTQWDLRDQRVGRANIWKSPPTGRPVTALPARWNGKEWVGGSKHQVGEAVDFAGTERAMVWMHANREAYGLARTVRTERWHMEANRRDTITGRIHDKPTARIRPFGAPTNPKELTMLDTEVAAAFDTINRKLDVQQDMLDRIIASERTDTARTLENVRGMRKVLAKLGLAPKPG